MIYCVEKFLNIQVNNPFISIIQIAKYFFHRHMRTAIWSKTITVLTKYWLIDFT